jgi:beta-glucanase (GH16 family)
VFFFVSNKKKSGYEGVVLEDNKNHIYKIDPRHSWSFHSQIRAKMQLSISVFLFVRFLTANLVVASWVDPDTPTEFRTTESLHDGDGRKYELVFSDEFEQDGRNFQDGNDPRWTALHKNDYTNAALHYYHSDNAETKDGLLKIKTEKKDNAYRAFDEKLKKFYNDKKHIQSAMLQGWNKFCFTGGIVEFSAKLPGSPRIGGLWPALWMLGNLARATYVGSSDYMWPYSYNQCDPSNRLSQEISACSRVHHYGMEDFRGRGAPEIDLIESMQGDAEKLPSTTITRPYQSASYQVAPGVERDRPVLGMKPKQGHWYTGMEYNHENLTKSELNPFFYGVTLVHKLKSYTYQADALSANRGLNASHYTSQHLYKVEWEPPAEDGSGGYIRWYTDNVFMYGIDGANLHTTGSEIPSEAMYLLMNTAVASSWGFPAPCPDGCSCECYECGNPDCACALPTGYCENFPASFDIDYVRVFQAVGEEKHTLGCSPKNRPTSLFIKGHQKRYMETGDNAPLHPIQKGGAMCRDNNDCGSRKHGHCSSRGVCVCKQNFTGPTCLAHSAFYINESVSGEEFSFGLDELYMPSSFIAWVAILLVFSLYSAYLAMRDRIKYRRPRAPEQTSPSPSTYQDSSDYALPPKQKVVTYCVVDGRLIDK